MGTGAREAEGSGLLSRPANDRRVGSNPTPSASECVTDAERGVAPTLESKASEGESERAGVRPSRASTPNIVDMRGWLRARCRFDELRRLRPWGLGNVVQYPVTTGESRERPGQLRIERAWPDA